ncbi:hypothetical protein FN976_24335 [Caenimonas sedimenti]|uniref:Uncharacterized protein n=1 Tax=Caenimonas sedimenti TaxID=2596921 RepID=A0A562ZIC5_9BURK|nr:hypothetical protein [Caenimonas sedimenti]TWO68068.1 hypothetical protein FN976_24335 [Caenimonas sedimenti]
MKEFPFDPYDFFGYLATGLLALFALQIIIGVPEILGKDLKALEIAAVTLAAYVVGQILATPAKFFLEDLLARAILKAPSMNLMRARRPWYGYVFYQYCTPLAPSARERVLAKVKQEATKTLGGEDLFVHVRFREYVCTNEKLIARINAFLNKYGFARNLSFACLAAGIAILATRPMDWNDVTVRYGVLALAAGIGLLFRFLKFYRQYTYELFNVYAGRP